VGALFIIATVTAMVSLSLLGSSLDGPDYLLGISGIEDRVTTAVVFEAILAISLIGIGSLMYPILRKHGENLALGYASIRLAEAVFIVIGTISMMLMLSVGQEFSSGGLDLADSESLGVLLMALREWSLLFGTLIFLGLGGLTLNYLLYVSRLVPRWLSVWGLIGAACVLMYGLLGLYGTDTNGISVEMLLALPIAVQEMVFAAWLIVKGFDPPSMA
jgi:hypothetical protein